MTTPTCGHWSNCGNLDGGCCAINLFGGRPSLGTCNRCHKNPLKGKMALVTVTVQGRAPTPEEIAAAKVAQEARNVVFRSLWREIHLAALSPDGLTHIKLCTILTRMPCGSCVKHFDAIRAGETFPVRFETTVGWQNAVNAELGKPLMTVDEARGSLLNADSNPKSAIRNPQFPTSTPPPRDVPP